jgi:hypothetical protein
MGTFISDFKPMTYSMLVNGDKTFKETVINLELLATKFKVDMKLENGVYVKTQNPAFVSISYYQIQNTKKADKPDFSFNNPPKGPIPEGFICRICDKTGPQFHDQNCSRPFVSSLVLGPTGTTLFPGQTLYTSYESVVKKSGQKKLVSTNLRSETFTDNVEIIYENEYNQGTTIRVSRNGTINIISAQIGDDDLPDLIITRIKATGAVLTPPFVERIARNIYFLTAQFNLIPENLKETNFIDLYTLHNNLWLLDIVKRKYGPEDIFAYGREYYFVSDYNYNNGGNLSRGNKTTNPYIQFTLVHPKILNVKINVMVYRKGAVQLKASYIDKTNPDGMKIEYLKGVYRFLGQIFGELINHEESEPTMRSEVVRARKSKIPNMVVGKDLKARQPQKCQDRDAGAGKIRPVPYSFYGVCPQPDSFVVSIKRDDGLYEPCCRKFSKTGKYTKANWKSMILNGYPDSLALADGDDPKQGDSAVYVPGTKIVEPRRHPGFKGMSREHLIGCIEKFNYLKKPDVFNKLVNTPILFNTIHPLTTLTPLTKEPFMVSPYYEDTIRVKLSFGSDGNSRFINEFGNTSDTTITALPELSDTILEGYLFPYTGKDFIFYPIDISVYKGNDVSRLDYYVSGNCRWKLLAKVVEIIKMSEPELKIEMRFDLNIVRGPGAYLNEDNVSGVLFLGYSGKFYLATKTVSTPKIINLYFKANASGRWDVSLDGSIPPNLLPQKDGVFLRASFTKGVPKEFLLECQLNINQTDGTVNAVEPLLPKSMLSSPIYTRQEVLSTLMTVKSPLSEDIFKNLNPNPLGFKFHENIYVYNGTDRPLTITAIE